MRPGPGADVSSLPVRSSSTGAAGPARAGGRPAPARLSPSLRRGNRATRMPVATLTRRRRGGAGPRVVGRPRAIRTRERAPPTTCSQWHELSPSAFDGTRSRFDHTGHDVHEPPTPRARPAASPGVPRMSPPGRRRRSKRPGGSVHGCGRAEEQAAPRRDRHRGHEPAAGPGGRARTALLYRLYRATALLLIFSGLLHLVVFAVDGGPWNGPLSWRKPVTFGPPSG